MRDRVVNFFFRSWKAKLIAIVVTVLLFLVYESTRIETVHIYLPVEIKTDNALVVDTNELPLVLVSITAEQNLFGRIDFRYLELEMDLSQHTEPDTYRGMIRVKNTAYLEKVEAVEIVPQYRDITLVKVKVEQP